MGAMNLWLEVLSTTCGISVLQAANKFCKPGKRARELSSESFSEIYQVFEFGVKGEVRHDGRRSATSMFARGKSSKISDGPHLNSTRRSGLDG
jgi:hypothetical protein